VAKNGSHEAISQKQLEDRMPTQTWVFLGICGIAVVILIVIIFVLAWKFKQKPKYRYAEVKRVIVMTPVCCFLFFLPLYTTFTFRDSGSTVLKDKWLQK